MGLKRMSGILLVIKIKDFAPDFLTDVQGTCLCWRDSLQCRPFIC